MTNIGKPYEGKPHVRFDEEELGSAQLFTLATRIICRDNLNEAFRRVKANKGSHGNDGVGVDELLPYLKE